MAIRLITNARTKSHEHVRMNTNGILRKHWLHVSTHFILDAVLFFLAFVGAIAVRFPGETEATFSDLWPSLVVGAVGLGAALYILGLYSTHSASQGIFRRSLIVTGAIGVADLVILALTYILSADPIGRGYIAIGSAMAAVGIIIHHSILLHGLRTFRERVAYIVSSPLDEVETRLFSSFATKNLELVGVITACGYETISEIRKLGSISDITAIVEREGIDRVLCTSKSLTNNQLTKHFCQLRYSGISVMPLILVCEEIEQYVPLELVTPEWLLNASGEPHLFYIRKAKRLFDITISILGMVLGAPILLAGMALVKLTSPGPIFYRQIRSGRFGRPFEILKLRTMRVDAEKHGAQWSSKNDPRVTWGGGFLRKYRIDEMPQLWNVLCGDMSFVGPRPERPEMITQIAQHVPFYEERLMVQPGITGWAQVSFPYGASVSDSRRKLEYDLYYMKHMSLFLDLFILLDTVRIVLTGGAMDVKARIEIEGKTMEEWRELHGKNSQLLRPETA